MRAVLKKPTHAAQRHGAAAPPRRSPELRVFEPAPWEPLPGVPPREQCRAGERPCRHVQCPEHLYVIAGVDRPGRRARAGERRGNPATTIYPGWLDSPPPPSCAADVREAIASGRITNVHGAVAKAIRVTERHLYEVLRGIKAKIRGNPAAAALLRQMLT